jgi:hypothetical protein
MIKPNRETFTPEALLLGERAYKTSHINEVLKEVKKNFPSYFSGFCERNEASIKNPNLKIIHTKKKEGASTILSKKFKQAIKNYEVEQPSYQEFFDLDSLEEFEENPNGFKSDLAKKIPIMRRSLQSQASDMKKFQSNYKQKSGRELLDVTRNIITFGDKYNKTFNDKKFEKTNCIADLGLAELSDEKYISHLVIGGGIKSCFLFSLYPYAFANRSQNALWSMYYLVNKKSFGFNDDSEFLMIHPKEGRTHQNYHYPYDLFTYYALQIYFLLKEACSKENITFQNKNRFIYLDTFFDYIAEVNEKEIKDLKKDGEYEG